MALGVDKEIFEYIRDPEIFTPPATLDTSIYQEASLASHFIIILSQPDAPIPPAVPATTLSARPLVATPGVEAAVYLAHRSSRPYVLLIPPRS